MLNSLNGRLASQAYNLIQTQLNGSIQHESGEKMDCGDGRHDHEGEESDEIDPGTDSQLQIDESEDVDVTEPDSKSIKLDSEQSYTDHTGKR